MKLLPISGQVGTVNSSLCVVEKSFPFEPMLKIASNAFCGSGPDHTPVSYTSTPADDEDRIREIVGTHSAGSCTQTVSPTRGIRYNNCSIENSFMK